MNKRGQITVFLILGILFLFISALVFYVVSKAQKTELATEEQFPLNSKLGFPLKSFVEDCISEIATPGIYLLAVQGGVIYPEDPQTILLTDNAIINYAYLNGINRLSTETMERELEQFVDENLPVCLDDFSVFAEEGIVVEEKGGVKSQVTINPNNIIISMDYKIDVEQGEDSLRIDSFSETIPLKLGGLVQEAEVMVQKVEKENVFLDVDPDTPFFKTVFPYDSSTIVYSLTDEQVSPNQAPLTFMFAVRDDTSNSPPELDYVPPITIQSGSQFTYQLIAHDPDDDSLIYSSDSTVFTVDENGLINQTITINGTYVITFTVEDSFGNKDQQEVRIIIKNEE